MVKLASGGERKNEMGLIRARDDAHDRFRDLAKRGDTSLTEIMDIVSYIDPMELDTLRARRVAVRAGVEQFYPGWGTPSSPYGKQLGLGEEG